MNLRTSRELLNNRKGLLISGKLIVVAGMLLISQLVTAATTHGLSWGVAVGDQGTTNIVVGDTVVWTWIDIFLHQIESTGGVENFDSGLITGVGQTFEHTFLNVGETNYQGVIHPSSFGTISASAVPLPATVWLFGSALGFLGWMRRKK